MLRQYKLSDYRFRLILWVVVLSTLGILIIGSANSEFQTRQMQGMIAGIVIMLIVSLFDYTWLLNFYWLIYLAGSGLLAAVLLVGTNVNGATRWINIGFQFQPSDIVKIMLIMFFAKFYVPPRGAVLYIISRSPRTAGTPCKALLPPRSRAPPPALFSLSRRL